MTMSRAGRMKTIVSIGQREFAHRIFQHDEEIPPSLLPSEAVDWCVDHKQVREYDSTERRSLHRLFSEFNGCSEKEQLSEDETTALALPQ